MALHTLGISRKTGFGFTVKPWQFTCHVNTPFFSGNYSVCQNELCPLICFFLLLLLFGVFLPCGQAKVESGF